MRVFSFISNSFQKYIDHNYATQCISHFSESRFILFCNSDIKKDEISYITISLFTLYKKLTQWPSKRGSKNDREEQEEKLINHFW